MSSCKQRCQQHQQPASQPAALVAVFPRLDVFAFGHVLAAWGETLGTLCFLFISTVDVVHRFINTCIHAVDKRDDIKLILPILFFHTEKKCLTS